MTYPIIGHRDVLDFFEKVISHGSLSHAYCLTGPDQVGKKRLAEYISGKLLNITEEELNKNPDFFLVKQEVDEKTQKKKKNISIEQISHVRSFLSQRPFVGKYKIVLVDEAEKMTLGAANALLKTLEEPPSYAVIFLITSDSEALPETILSRSQTVYVGHVGRSDVVEFLQNQKFDEDTAQEMARLSLGLPGRSIRWMEDMESYEQYKNEVQRFYSILGKPFSEKLHLVEDLFGDKKDHIRSREYLQEILHIWSTLVRDSALDSFGLKDEKIHVSTDTYFESITMIPKLYERMQESVALLSKNVHPRLIVEHVLLALP